MYLSDCYLPICRIFSASPLIRVQEACTQAMLPKQGRVDPFIAGCVVYPFILSAWVLVVGNCLHISPVAQRGFAFGGALILAAFTRILLVGAPISSLCRALPPSRLFIHSENSTGVG
jgi:hypothetical protein